MDKYILPEGEACLLVAVFEHLREYSERAKENDTSVSDELSECTEDISVYADALSYAMGNCLNDREYDVIAQRYELSPYKKCSTLEEIARNFNVTRERIRQLEAKALKKIHHYMTELTDEETDKVAYNLQADVQEHLMDAVRARTTVHTSNK
jgi:DNA-directed RNA polymerase sigma subunit (sigma70/sigma32)